MEEGPRPRRDRTGDAGFVSLLQAGDESAFGLLVDAWADPLYDRLSHHGFTTADALDLSAAIFATAHHQVQAGASGEPFGVQVLRIARQEAAAAADRRVDLFLAVGPSAGDRLAHGTDAAVLGTEETVATFLFEAATLLGESAREVLDLHHRFDFAIPDVAMLLGLPVDAVADLDMGLPDAYRELVGIQLVWRQGQPSCPTLAAALTRHSHLDAGTRRAVVEHLRGCERCRSAATPALDPLVVLAEIPIAVAPVGFKPALVEALGRAGLPVSGSVAYRLPRGGRSLSAADPPPHAPRPYPGLVAVPPVDAAAPARPGARFSALSSAARREPELASLMIGDPTTAAPTTAAPTTDAPTTAAPVAAPPPAAAAPPAQFDSPVGDAPLAPPPALDAPAPVVPPLDVPSLGSSRYVSRQTQVPAMPAPRRRRWFRPAGA